MDNRSPLPASDDAFHLTFFVLDNFFSKGLLIPTFNSFKLFETSVHTCLLVADWTRLFACLRQMNSIENLFNMGRIPKLGKGSKYLINAIDDQDQMQM